MSITTEEEVRDTAAAAHQSIAIEEPAVVDDLTGRDRLVWNVVASWAGHLVFIIAGFIMPRQIDRHIGQVGLGVWDFGWSAVNYFFLAQIGVGVSVNRYVARYRAAHDIDGLNRMISSVMLLQIGAAGIVMLLTAASAMWLPSFFSSRLGGEADVARWVIALLGTSVALRMATQAYSGVMTGCHRWDLHNLLNSVAYGLTVAAMLATLWRGYGLIAISVVYVIGTVLNEIVRVVMSYRVCPELSVSPRRARWSESRKLIAFGAKLSSNDAVTIIVAQMTNMLVLSQIGIGTLAVFSRLGALIRHTENIASKYSLPLTPTASSLQRTGQEAEIRDLLIGSTRIAAYLVWPILLGLAIVGDAVLQVWMGPHYNPSHVLMLMAGASMFPISQQPIAMILVGLNMHGRAAALRVLSSLLGFAASLFALHYLHWDLLGLAGVTLAVSNIISFWVAADTCRRLSIPVRLYFIKSYAGPLACAAPFAIGLAFIGTIFQGQPLLTCALACAFGICLLGPLYWRVIPDDIRTKVLRGISSKLAALGLVVQPGVQ